MQEPHNPYSFFPTDIVVWNGIIAQYGTISPFVDEFDSIKKASERDVQLYVLTK